MNKKFVGSKEAADKLVKNIHRKTARKYSAEEKTHFVSAGLRGEESIATLCLRERIAKSLYYKWSKEFLEAGKHQLSGDTARQASAVLLLNTIPISIACQRQRIELTTPSAWFSWERRSVITKQVSPYALPLQKKRRLRWLIPNRLILDTRESNITVGRLQITFQTDRDDVLLEVSETPVSWRVKSDHS